MTREEAIFCEKSYIGETRCTDCKYYGTETCQSRESHKMAIKALEQEPITKNDLAQQRYQDLIEYFGDEKVAKTILESRKEFKAWLERLKWIVKRADELAEELEQLKPATKNDLGVDYISRDSAIKALGYDIKSFEFKSGVSKYMDDIAKLLDTIYEIQVNNIKALPSVTPQESQSFKWCTDCKEYDQEKHCCHRYSKVIRDTVAEIEQKSILDKIRAEIEKIQTYNCIYIDRTDVFKIIDKYKAESEG